MSPNASINRRGALIALGNVRVLAERDLETQRSLQKLVLLYLDRAIERIEKLPTSQRPPSLIGGVSAQRARERLDARHLDCLHIVADWEADGLTQARLAELLGVQPNAARERLVLLRQRGLVYWEPGTSRSYELTTLGRAVLEIVAAQQAA